MKYGLLALAFIMLLASGCTIKEPGPGTCPQNTVWNPGLNCCLDSANICVDNSVSKTLMLWEDWQTTAILVLLIGFLLMGIAYMIAYAFDYKPLMIFVKSELFQLAASAFIFANVLFFMFLFDSLAQEYSADILALHTNSSAIVKTPSGWQVTANASINASTYNPATGRWAQVTYTNGQLISCPSPCHFYLARGYLGMNYERIAVMARSVINTYSSLAWIDRIRVGIFINVFAIAFTLDITVMPFTGLSIIYNSLGTCFDLMAKAMVAVKFQEITLMYIQNGIFPIFLIGGLILRSIWFMRKLGGLMLAIAIALYTIFPLMYVLCWYTVDSSTVTLQINSNMIPVGDPRIPLLPWQSSNMETSNLEKLLFTTYNGENIASYGMLDMTAGLLLPALAIPLLNIFVTVAFIRTLSASLGGDIELAGLTRIL